MCLGPCVPFVMTGEMAKAFDRSILTEYNAELGNTLHIEDAEDQIVVSFTDGMCEPDKNNAHLILEIWGFQ